MSACPTNERLLLLVATIFMVSASNVDMKSFAAGALANLAIEASASGDVAGRLDEPHPSSPTPNRFLSAMADLEGRAHRRARRQAAVYALR